jgi:hypothetical protein
MKDKVTLNVFNLACQAMFQNDKFILAFLFSFSARVTSSLKPKAY